MFKHRRLPLKTAAKDLCALETLCHGLNEVGQLTVLNMQPNAWMVPIEGKTNVFRVATPRQARASKREALQKVPTEDWDRNAATEDGSDKVA